MTAVPTPGTKVRVVLAHPEIAAACDQLTKRSTRRANGEYGLSPDRTWTTTRCDYARFHPTLDAVSNRGEETVVSNNTHTPCNISYAIICPKDEINKHSNRKLNLRILIKVYANMRERFSF